MKRGACIVVRRVDGTPRRQQQLDFVDVGAAGELARSAAVRSGLASAIRVAAEVVSSGHIMPSAVSAVVTVARASAPYARGLG